MRMIPTNLRLVLTVFIALFLTQFSFSQDTIMVQGFDYKSTTRDSLIAFPEGDHNQYQKIWMIYNMRCKEGLVSTGSDRNRGCGEWDYSCNTSIIDSSRIDSIPALHPSYLISGWDGDLTFDYVTEPTYTYYRFEQSELSVDDVISESFYAVGDGDQNATDPFDASMGAESNLYLFTSDELSQMGAGQITGMQFDIAELGDDLEYLRIKIAHTDVEALSPSTVAGLDFVQVYHLNTSFSSTGIQQLNFYEGFDWNGDDNIIVKIEHDGTGGNASTVKSNNALAESALNSSSSDGYIALNESLEIEIPVDGMETISEQITVAFWSYGNESVLPKNTSVFHANDGDGIRQLNVHLPWSNSRVYWDCGNDGGGYDRIEKAANKSDFAGQWNHWAFTKNTETGIMRMYLNGEVWHIGSGFTKTIDIKEFAIGSSNTFTNTYNGSIDDFSVWNVEMLGEEITDLMYGSLNADHPKYDNLVRYFDFNENGGNTFVDQSSFASSATLSNQAIYRRHRADQIFKSYEVSDIRPNVTLVRGEYDADVVTTTILDSIQNPPNKVVEYQVENNDLVILDPIYLWEAGTMNIINEEGNIVGTKLVSSDNFLIVQDLSYFSKNPAKMELMSFVTPYGIGLDFGLNGRTWIFDVTDYAPILNGNKRLRMDRGGQWQEQMDIQFMFVKGTPPRNVLDVHQVWPVNSNSYNAISLNNRLEPRRIPVEAEVEGMRLKVVSTGHGQEGEFMPRNHSLNINGGGPEYSFQLWSECAFNPVYPQGGTWVYDRAGWCPGAPSDIREWEIMQHLDDGDEEFTLDYSVAFADGTSNYIVNTQVFKYGEHNYANEASIERIVAPSLLAEDFRFNPMCNKPMVQIKNNGSEILSSLKFKYGVIGGTEHYYDWEGFLGFGETEIVSLPQFNPAMWGQGVTFDVEISNPNGQVDENPDNDKKQTEYNAVPYLANEIVVEIRTNAGGNETSWTLRDDSGSIVASRIGGMSTFTTYTDTISGLNGCYELKFSDAGQDGISWWANNDGDGYVRVRSIDEGFYTLQPDFGGEITFNFTTGIISSNEDVEDLSKSLEIYPNPVQDQFKLVMEGYQGDCIVELYNELGAKIMTKQKTNLNPGYDEINIDMGGAINGIYLVKIENQGKYITRKIVKQD